jgi:nucleoside-diphosphate-sugar epimerase
MSRRIFIAGATGQIGRMLTPALVEGGDEVFGLARSEESARKVEQLGATPIMGDALDRDQVLAAVAEARPEVIVHQLTAIPRMGINPRRFAAAFGPTNRLRREATMHLAEAAEQNGVRLMLAQSIAFAYRAEGPDVVDEAAELDVGGQGAWGEIAGAVSALEDAVIGGSGFSGVVLRYGSFYGPGTAYDRDGALGELVLRRRLPIIGRGGGRQPFIHMDDAVSATLVSLDRGAGIYNVTDDDSPLARDWIPALATTLGAPQPRRIPRWLGLLVAGQDAVRAMTDQRGASNARIRGELGWSPRYATWREGFETLRRP